MTFQLRLGLRLCLLLSLAVPACHAQVYPADWMKTVKPFQIADDLYYVGSQDLAAYLVTTPAGLILINANTPQSPPQIRKSVEALGFRWKDIRILLISHAHVDHAGGAAAIRRQTGAKLEVMDGDVDVMETGGEADFAFGGKGKPLQFPPVHVDKVLHSGDAVTLGGISITALRTAGHTRGNTTFTMQAHVPGEPAGSLQHVVIVGSWSVLDSYRLLTVRGGKPASYPGIAGDYTQTFATLAALPCDVFLASHGSFFELLGKLKRMPSEGDRVWVDPQGYRRALAAAQQRFEIAYRRELHAAEVP